MILGSTWDSTESRDTQTRGGSWLYPGMIQGSTWDTRESRDTETRGDGWLHPGMILGSTLDTECIGCINQKAFKGILGNTVLFLSYLGFLTSTWTCLGVSGHECKRQINEKIAI